MAIQNPGPDLPLARPRGERTIAMRNRLAVRSEDDDVANGGWWFGITNAEAHAETECLGFQQRANQIGRKAHMELLELIGTPAGRHSAAIGFHGFPSQSFSRSQQCNA